MSDEKKAVNTSEAKKSDKKDKKPSKFSPKNIGKGIARFFKDLRGETKKIVWPGRQMVIKSTGVVLASILVIGIFIWAIDFAVSGAVTAVNKAASETTEVVTTTEATKGDENDEDTSDKADDAEEESTEATTTA
jgi:preprotein translocase subunit SecE